MIVVVTGSRDWKRADILNKALDTLSPTLVFHGGARGADTLAGKWCDEKGVDCLIVPALWTGHGKQAGTLRNKRMLELAKMIAESSQSSIKVAAFPLPDSIGTKHCMSQAKKMGIAIEQYSQTTGLSKSL
jgi:hypothetical protein